MNKKLVKHFSEQIISKKEVQQPLFVTTPLDKKQFSSQLIDQLKKNDWEIDDMGGSYYLLRSIPKSLNHLSLHLILPLIAKSESYDYNLIDNSLWEQILHFFSVNELIENKILIPCTPPYEK